MPSSACKKKRTIRPPLTVRDRTGHGGPAGGPAHTHRSRSAVCRPAHAAGHAIYEDPLCFFFNDTATTEIYTLSLHDALPIQLRARVTGLGAPEPVPRHPGNQLLGRKSTRLNPSHTIISQAVFCLTKKTQ